MQHLTVSKLLFNPTIVNENMTKNNLIKHSGNTSLIYKIDNFYHVLTIETIKAEWLYHIELIKNYNYVGDAVFKGYNSRNKYKIVELPVTYYKIKILSDITSKRGKTMCKKYIKDLQKNYYGAKDHWLNIANSAQYSITKQIGNFALDYLNIYCDAFYKQQWKMHNGKIVCIDPFVSKDVYEAISFYKYPEEN